MADLIGATVLIIAGVISLAALFTTLTYLLPARTAQTQHVAAVQPGRSLLIGLVNALFFGVLAAVLAQFGDAGGLLALLLLLALGGLSAVGLAGIVRLLQARAFSGEEGVGGLGKTAVLLILAALAPFVGWFVLAPLLLLTGLGAAIMALAKRGA